MIELTPLPHREAIAYFEQKGFAPQLQRFDHRDHWREEHARDFVVAKAMRDDITALFRDEMLRALKEGRTLAQFTAELEPRLRKEGWWGTSIMTDPLTGEAGEVQLGSLRRLRTIYDTNMRTAHAAGHWTRIQRTRQAFPYLHYIQIERPNKRHDHAKFHDKIWRVDDPVWLRIYPPNGYFCGCTVIQRTEGWMRRNGREVSGPIDLDEQPWTNKRTGEVFEVPRGVHPGFDSNPGATWLDIEEAVEEVTPDLPPERQAFERGLVQAVRLRQTSLQRETLIVSDASGETLLMTDADPKQPDLLSIDTALAENPAFEAEPVSVMRSRLTDTPLSFQDFQQLEHPRIASILAVTPGGALWRARPATEPMGDQAGIYAARAMPVLQDEMAAVAPEDRDSLIQHGFGLFLERRGVIHYHYSLTGRLRDLFERFAGLVERLST